MKKFLLTILPPNGEKYFVEVPLCDSHNEVNSNDRTFLDFYNGNDKVMSVVVSQTHSYVLVVREVLR